MPKGCQEIIMLKIAQVCPRYSPDIGGVETHVKEISERLVKRGHIVDVITTDPTGKLPSKETINGVNVTRIRSVAPGTAYFFSPGIYSYLKGEEYDVVHAHSYHAFPAFFAALANAQGKFVFTPHYHRSGHTFIRDLLHKPYRLLGKSIFSKADVVICVSDYEKTLLSEDFDVSAKIMKIPNGINLSEFQSLKPRQKTSTEKTLLYVGRLEEYKGVQHIIQCLPELPGFKLIIVGKGPYESRLRELADSLGVSGRIEWLKDVSRDELLQCYASADVFLMLSKHEAYGITVAEALAAGTPCVVAKGSALDEFVDGEMCIGLIDSSNIRALSLEIRKMLALRSNSGYNKSKKYVILGWDQIAEKIGKIYEHFAEPLNGS